MRAPRRKALTATGAALETMRLVGAAQFAMPRDAYVDDQFVAFQSASHAAIYAGQESVRTVVDYLARNAAKRTLGVHRRFPDGRKDGAGDHPAAASMRWPNDWTRQQQLVEELVRDYLVYDSAFLWDVGGLGNDRRMLVRVPPHAIGVRTDNNLAPTGFRLMYRDGTFKDLPVDAVIHWRGYSAANTGSASSAMETLRTTLLEETTRKAQAVRFIKGGMVKGGIIKRPLEAPELNQKGLERLAKSFAEALRGVTAGATPVLDEGMDFIDAGVTPKEAEAVQSRILNKAAVAQLFGLHPALFGWGDGDLAAARQAAEEDVLDPLCGRLAETLTGQLIGRRYEDEERGFYFGFDPPEETDIGRLADAAVKMAGGAVLTADEARELYLRLPPLADGQGAVMVRNPGATMGTAMGGDVPEAPASADRGRPEAPKSEEFKALVRRQRLADRRDYWAEEHSKAIRRHFRRQRNANAKAAVATARWNRELADELYKVGMKQVEDEGAQQAERLMGEFDPEQVRHYVRAGAKAMAANVNASTADLIREAGAKDDAAVSDVLTAAIAERSDELGIGRATSLMGFAAMEAAKQNQGVGAQGLRVKSWVGSGKPQSRHTAVSGETVPLFTPFSNGLQYPGDPSGSAHETAGCRCLLDVS